MKVFKSLGLLFLVVIILGSSGDAFAVSNPSKYVITIKSVQLKKVSGEWITVIEPDHEVDLVSQQPAVSFFNNNGRVPAGAYNNFRVEFFENSSGLSKTLSAKNDFRTEIAVRRGSFIRVLFEVTLGPKIQVDKASVVVDNEERNLEAGNLSVA